MTEGVHIATVTAAHAYTRSREPWRLDEVDARADNASDRTRGLGWRLFHYISGGGMRAFGRTVRQDEVDRRRTRFLFGTGVAAVVWLVLLLA